MKSFKREVISLWKKLALEHIFLQARREKSYIFVLNFTTSESFILIIPSDSSSKPARQVSISSFIEKGIQLLKKSKHPLKQKLSAGLLNS